MFPSAHPNGSIRGCAERDSRASPSRAGEFARTSIVVHAKEIRRVGGLLNTPLHRFMKRSCTSAAGHDDSGGPRRLLVNGR